MASTQTDRIRGLIGTLGMKAPCLAATTANITLSATQTIDGVAVVAEDRVLVKNQTDATENGIYYCQAAAWVRAPDFDGTQDIMQGTLVNVVSGTVNRKTVWQMSADEPVIGTDSITFVSWLSPTYQVLTDGATISWDADDGAFGYVTIAGNRTFAAPTNMRNGEAYTLMVVQDGTGSRTITWNSAFKWPWNGLAPVLSTAAGAKDLFSFVYYDGALYGVGPQKRLA